MSYRSLLFCQDEKTARVITQVLSELDFTVETAHEPFAAVQRLSQEQFHAILVDCQNEQDAALLFKAARSSAHNTGSLSVAVVEGQAGVAKAFRIGANLVLTKPVNVEQSKGTLRVARGLLKKTQTKPAAAPLPGASAQVISKPQLETSAPVPSSEPTTLFEAATARSFSSPMASKFVAPLAPAASASVPYSGLVLESEPEPATEAADAAVLESMPEITGKRPLEGPASIRFTEAAPIAASTSGHAAAAVALAPETKASELLMAGAAPVVSNEPIVGSSEQVETNQADSIDAPTFSALDSASGGSTGGTRFLKIAVVVALIGGAGYYALQQPKVKEYTQRVLQRVKGPQSAPASTDLEPADRAQPTVMQSPTEAAQGTPQAHNATQPSAASTTASTPDYAATTEHSSTAKSGAIETIEVQELPFSRDNGKISVAPKPQTIVVRNSPAAQNPGTSSQPAPPPMNIVSAGPATLPNLTPASGELPNPAPGTVRISQGVSQGLLIKKVQPVYPAVAKQFHREGSVQLLTTIDKYGEIKKVQVLGGDAMLVRAAVDAVKQWEYRPYLLNGQPVEIETQITVIFKAPN